MKKHFLFGTMALMGLALSSCHFSFDFDALNGETITGNRNVVVRNYDVADFNEISTSLPATVNFSVAETCSCTVRVDENLFDCIEIKVKNGALKLRVVMDRYSLELFVNDGEQAASFVLYTPLEAASVSFSSDGSVLVDVEKYDLLME